MDNNGYYTAVYQNSKGMIPANFVQEIEVQDEDLMTRLTNQVKPTSKISQLNLSSFCMQSVVWTSKFESMVMVYVNLCTHLLGENNFRSRCISQ